MVFGRGNNDVQSARAQRSANNPKEIPAEVPPTSGNRARWNDIIPHVDLCTGTVRGFVRRAGDDHHLEGLSTRASGERAGEVPSCPGRNRRLAVLSRTTLAQFRIWLTDSDPNGIIKIEEREHEVSEEGLGVYRVPRLDLHAFGKSVAIIPKVIHSCRNGFPAEQVPSRTCIGSDRHYRRNSALPFISLSRRR